MLADAPMTLDSCTVGRLELDIKPSDVALAPVERQTRLRSFSVASTADLDDACTNDDSEDDCEVFAFSDDAPETDAEDLEPLAQRWEWSLADQTVDFDSNEADGEVEADCEIFPFHEDLLVGTLSPATFGTYAGSKLHGLQLENIFYIA
mmetsp:Transcript_49243/g.77876  ORF Transcript_49243/g.77876 Transcript_49243/m.77876 type:complete len:149 (+) Transcript_49243:56-502(+)